MTNLFLHIGSAKTATSTIQRHLFANYERLKDAGFCYPATGQHEFAHHHIAGKLRPELDERFTTETSYEQLLEETFAECQGCENIILSSEALWHHETIDRSLLRNFLSRFNTRTIIAYIRRQDSYAVAFFNTWIRFRLTPNAPDFPAYCQAANLDYFDNISNWQEIAGPDCNFVVRPFVKEAWKNSSVIEDFVNCIAPSLKLEGHHDRVNESPPIASTALLRYINRNDVQNRERLRSLLEQWTRNFPSSDGEGLLTTETQTEILQRYEASNRALADRFWTRGEFDAFQRDHVPTSQHPYAGPSLEEVASIISNLWNMSNAATE